MRREFDANHLAHGIISQLQADFSSTTRLYELVLNQPPQGSHYGSNHGASTLLVEAFAAVEELHGHGARDLLVLSTSAHIPLKTLLGQCASLHSSLSDGQRCQFTGLINQAAMLGREGGLARYRLRLVPWVWLLTQSRTSRVWQDQRVRDIAESIFARYPAHAAWRWSEDVAPFMADVPARSYCVQYRETDYDFLRRLLTEEGLSWRLEEAAQAPSGHRLVLFADSTQTSATPEDATSAHALGGAGIRFHGARACEEQDSIQALGAKRVLNVALTSVLSMDYKAKQSISASAPTHHQFGGANAPVLESFDAPGLYAFANGAQAQRYACLHQEAHEARNKTWLARSTVRTLRAGTRFGLSQGPLSKPAPSPARSTPPSPASDPCYVVLRVASVGINNLPTPSQASLAELFGPLPVLLQDCLQDLSGLTALAEPLHDWPTDAHPLITQATTLGYANQFEAIRADIPWRAVRSPTRGTSARGSQTAIVVGAQGQSSASGADEIYCDRLGRVRIRFHWQGQNEDASATCWVRVAQRWAGGAMGSQFLPRIGQEVLVQFVEGDIDRPVIIAALYNGQGEGGTIPTPGGNTAQEAKLTVFERAHDHAASAQGNLVGGHSPLWHGASPDAPGQRNASAQWGIRSKEFGAGSASSAGAGSGSSAGAAGYNQLVFDDTDQQGRIQLKTTHAATALNLGHLIHSADNYRGSLRGLGAELRTDAYGAVRAGKGVLISSYAVQHDARQRGYAADNAPGMAMLKQAVGLSKTFSQAAKQHMTVQYASHIGSLKPDTSHIAQDDKKAAAIKALHTAASGMLSQETLAQAQSDATNKATQPESDKLAHSTDPIIAISAKAGLGMTAGQDLQWANGETSSFMSGQDSQFITGHQFRMHTGQAIGMLAGAVKPGDKNLGLQLIAAKDAIDIQAQSDAIRIQAKDEIDILSSHAHIDWAAAKSISLSTAGGANITIAGGNITVQCPGKILIQAGMKSFIGPDRLNYPMPTLPKSAFEPKPLKFKIRLVDMPGPDSVALANTPWQILRLAGGKTKDRVIAKGETDAKGEVILTSIQEKKVAIAYARAPNDVWISYPGQMRLLDVITEQDDWSDKDKAMHALAAMDYSERSPSVGGSEAHDTATMAKRDFDFQSLPKLFDEIKK